MPVIPAIYRLRPLTREPLPPLALLLHPAHLPHLPPPPCPGRLPYRTRRRRGRLRTLGFPHRTPSPRSNLAGRPYASPERRPRRRQQPLSSGSTSLSRASDSSVSAGL